MKVTLTWVDPTLREDGSALDAIAFIRIAAQVGGAGDFTELAQVPPGVQTFVQTDLPAGVYVFAATVVDTQRVPQESAVALLTVTIEEPLKAPPAAVTELAATVEAG